jgi:hypothetical protein
MLGVRNPVSIVELKTGKANAAHEMSLVLRWRFKKQPAADHDVAPSFALQLLQNTDRQQLINHSDQ